MVDFKATIPVLKMRTRAGKILHTSMVQGTLAQKIMTQIDRRYGIALAEIVEMSVYDFDNLPLDQRAGLALKD